MKKENDSIRKKLIRRVAVIFLVVLLALTFFSNTIMNYSLPEVATTYVSEGTVASKVRVQGDLETSSDYDVTVSGSRVVKEVLVEAGDEVKAGQVLVKFEEGENTELEEAKDSLESMELDYAKSLLTAAPDYEEDNIGIKDAKETLADAIKKQDKLKTLDKKLKKAKKEESAAKKAVSAAQSKVDATQDQIDAQQKKIDKLQAQLDSYADIGDYKALSTQIAEAEKTLAALKVELSDLNEDLKTLQQNGAGSDEITEKQRAIRDKQTAISDAEKSLTSDKTLLKSLEPTVTLQNNIKTENATMKTYQSNLTDYQKALTKAQSDLTDKSAVVTDLSAGGTLEEAKTAVKDAEKNLSSLIRALDDKKEQDALNEQTAAMDRKTAEENIAKQKEKIAQLENSSDINEVKAKEAGIVASIDCKVGDNLEAGAAIGKIQLASSGYVVKATITKDQAKLLRVDDEATIENIWEDGVSATVKSVKADPSNPQQSMIVTFDVKGDIAPGTSLQIMAGEKSGYYDTVVPNNAIREDSQGKFVLVVNVKGTPLGNRYTVERVSVDVQASDEQNSAISGAIQSYENVVTNSSKPLESGKQVRLAE